MIVKKLSMLLCVVLLLNLAGCGTTPEPPVQETAPAALVPATGNPEEVTCQSGYYAEQVPGDTVVATVGEASLTNEQLQVYYWMEVAACRQENKAGAPDFSRSLEDQLVPLSSQTITWQQFFLREALTAWHSQQALVQASGEYVVPTEEAYKPNMEDRLNYMTGMPATKYLYGWNEGYTVNRLHQAYLDELPQTLEALASDRGFGSPEALAAAAVGTGSGPLEHYAQLLNRAYMFLTEAGYRFEPTAEEIQAYHQAHQSSTPTEGDRTVTIRQILLRPDNARISEDGTVTASEEDWALCLTEAETVVEQWQKAIKKTRYASSAPVDVAESRFSEAAHRHSADTGFTHSGGLYDHLRQGQLAPELDSWCFDSQRQHGDYEIIRSACGYHIVFFSAADQYTAAEAAMREQHYASLVAQAMEDHPMTVDYSLIALTEVPENGASLTPGDLLYPDVAHQRYPDMPLYLQQDYPDTKYGFYPLRTHGCGITSLAMVASYMLDEELTPAELSQRYGYYCGERGSELVLFDDTPAELGFQVQKRSSNWDEISAALQNGQKVINLQFAGYWTTGGHYIVMDSMTEDGRYVVRDSNLFGYGKIADHRIDSHTRGSIRSEGQYYWIFEPKTVHHPGCVRCAENGQVETPEAMLSGYVCGKCRTAVERRDGYLSGFAG